MDMGRNDGGVCEDKERGGCYVKLCCVESYLRCGAGVVQVWWKCRAGVVQVWCRYVQTYMWKFMLAVKTMSVDEGCCRWGWVS